MRTYSDCMWLKSFKINEKALSDIELVVLSNISDEEYISATDLIDTLDTKLDYWTPERGTMYPLLHRLTDQNLLSRAESRTLKFKRTASATTFLSSLLSSNELLAQFDTTTRYMEILAESMVEIDPFAAKEFMQSFVQRIEKLQTNFNRFLEKTDELVKDEGWTEIDVE